MAITFKPFIIECITNLHVGSGDANYGIVDKLVQRDSVTGHPTIHSTSLKGALKEHFEQKWGTGSVKLDSIFGKEGKGGSDSETGEYKFLTADIMAIPVRCNFESYALGLNKKLADDINVKAKLFGFQNIFNTIVDSNSIYFNPIPTYDIYAEDIVLNKITYTNPLNVTGYEGLSDKYASFHSIDFESISKNLPVIARNKLGKDNNLWYEEIVPHKTLFITYIGVTDTHLTEFETALKDDLIQIGANASVGYGLCKFYPITFNTNQL